MSKQSICAFAPATIANLNVGFDILGMALSTVGDKVKVTLNSSSENKILQIINGPGIPTDSAKNCCSVVIQKMQEKLGSTEKVDIRINKGFPSGSGLGSSSASSAAAAFAYNELMGTPFSLEELVLFASEGERVACGSAHLDNVAPAILGGLVLVQNQNLIRLPIPESLFAVSFFPQVEVKTADSRSVLKSEISLQTSSHQTALTASFVSSLYENDLERFSESMKDIIVEPQRKNLIPRFDEMKESAFKNGALAFGISGSGPSVFAFANSKNQADKIESELKSVFAGSDIATMSFTESVHGNKGARLTTFS